MKPSEHRFNIKLGGIQLDLDAGRQDPGYVLQQSSSRDVSQSLDELLLDARQECSYVNTGGHQELLAIRLVCGAEGGWLVVSRERGTV